MFFRKARKFIFAYYFIYLSFVMLIYFILFKEYGFEHENYTINSLFSQFSKITNLLLPSLIIFYLFSMVVIVKFLVNYTGKRDSITNYIFYIASSISGLFFYFLMFYLIYLPLKKLIIRLKAVSLTEVPIIISYFIAFLLIMLLWKVITYWKISARINYFNHSFSLKYLLLPLNGFNPSKFLKFLSFVVLINGIALLLLFYGVVLHKIILIKIAIFYGILVFPYSHLFVYYLLMDKDRI